MYIKNGAFPTIINNTFHMNSTIRGGAIFCQDASNPIIRNNIFSQNTAGVGILTMTTGSFPILDHNVFWKNSGDVYMEDSTPYPTVADMDAGIAGATENRECDPKFVDPGKDDFHLLMGSCCIDTGNPTNAPTEDFDGDARPMGSAYDIGFDEFEPVPVPLLNIRHIFMLGILVSGIAMVFSLIIPRKIV